MGGLRFFVYIDLCLTFQGRFTHRSLGRLTLAVTGRDTLRPSLADW